MPDYSLVPVDDEPDFDNCSLVPVDYDPFAADRPAQQAQFQRPPTPTQPAQPRPQQPATGAGQPGVNGPATGNSPSGSGGGATGVPPTRLWIKAQPKLLPLAATLIRRQQTLLHQTLAY